MNFTNSNSDRIYINFDCESLPKMFSFMYNDFYHLYMRDIRNIKNIDL